MGFTYEWKLVGLKKQNGENIDDAVVGTQWKLKATDEDGNEGTFTGATPFSISTINTSSFTPYSEVTRNQVVDWIDEAADTDSMKFGLDMAINKTQIVPNTTNIDNLPWNK